MGHYVILKETLNHGFNVRIPAIRYSPDEFHKFPGIHYTDYSGKHFIETFNSRKERDEKLSFLDNLFEVKKP